MADDGPGIRPDERDAVLNRFHRTAATARLPDHGLGLSLVAAIVKLQGFELKIDGAERGCVVSMIVPSVRFAQRTATAGVDQPGRAAEQTLR